MKWKLKKNNLKPNKMKSKIQSILNKTQFFSIINSTNSSVAYTLQKPSQFLIRNIYINWLRYSNQKTHKVLPVHLQKINNDFHAKTKGERPPFGTIKYNEFDYTKTFEYIFDAPIEKMALELKLIIPQRDLMQYFVQWQRYRKYWWSSITTTPSLFAIGDTKQGETGADADIVAKLPCGIQTVEQIKIKNCADEFEESACLTCTMSLERALFILLMDGLSNDSKDEYLRLHRKIAPYKISFGLKFEDTKNMETLKELATLLFHRLSLENISAYLPDFSKSLEDQIKENSHMGIPYTAILNEITLENGIFHLLNSSTTLKEQIHVADFHTYAAVICNDK